MGPLENTDSRNPAAATMTSSLLKLTDPFPHKPVVSCTAVNSRPWERREAIARVVLSIPVICLQSTWAPYTFFQCTGTSFSVVMMTVTMDQPKASANASAAVIPRWAATHLHDTILCCWWSSHNDLRFATTFWFTCHRNVCSPPILQQIDIFTYLWTGRKHLIIWGSLFGND